MCNHGSRFLESKHLERSGIMQPFDHFLIAFNAFLCKTSGKQTVMVEFSLKDA